jgi:predicted nucleic acid-binding Zn ribbon protein
MRGEKNMALITKHCPHCGTLINYDDSEKNVCCLGCDRMLSTEELRSNLDTVALEDKKGGVADQTASLASFLVQSIETAESGLAYLENFFENYD